MHKKRQRQLLVLMWLFYIAGFSFFSYPFIASKYHEIQQRNIVRQYQKEVVDFDQETLRQIKEQLNKSNQVITKDQKTMKTEDFAIEAERKLEEETGIFSSKEEVGDVIAVLEVPKIHLELPVYYGTNTKQISQGAGVMKETSLPIGGKGTHSVITSHRGLPTAKLFTDLPKLSLNDNFFIKVANETHAYEVDQIKVIEPDDYSELQIIPGEDYVTLLTCTPYMINSHRLLVRGKRITPYSPLLRKQEEKKGFWQKIKQWLLVLLVLVVTILFFYGTWRKTHRKVKR